MLIFSRHAGKIKIEEKKHKTYNSSYNLTQAIFRVLIGRQLIFAHPRDQRDLTQLENMR